MNKFNVVCPQHLSDLMKADNTWSAHLSGEQKCLVLGYLCCQGDSSLLEDLQLLPLADGTFCAYSDHVVYVCRDEQDLSLLPGLHDRMAFISQPEGLHGRLRHLAESGNRKCTNTLEQRHRFVSEQVSDFQSPLVLKFCHKSRHRQDVIR